VNAGYITGTDGKTYQFSKSDWLSARDEPAPDKPVDFETKGRQALMVTGVTKSGEA
jgi:hypothetical protein